MEINIATILVQMAGAILAIKYYRSLPYIVVLFITFSILIIGIRSIAITQLPDITAFTMSTIMLVGLFVAPKISSRFKQENKHLKSLKDIDRAMLTSLSHNTLMNAIVEKLNTALDTDATAILTFTDSDKKLNTFATYNLSEKIQRCLESHPENNGFISSVIDNQKPLIISKIVDDEEEDFLKTLRTEGFVSYLGSPIIKNGISIGLLTLYSKKPRRYTKREMALINAIGSQIGIAMTRARLITRIHEMSFESVRALVEAIEIRDPYTRGHSVTVADLSVKIAQELEFNNRELKLIAFAGLLHDVGKIAIPEVILQKTTPLSDEDWTIIKKHPEHSAKVVELILELRYIQNWVLHHHERWDGNGYPDGRKGEEIPLESRILAVCDTYSAMTGGRPYRKALSDEDTRNEMAWVAGTQLDPHIVDIFLKLPSAAFSLSKNSGEEKGVYIFT